MAQAAVSVENPYLATATQSSSKRARTENDISQKDDPALLAAWRRFLDYDRVSSEQKRSNQRIREWIILLGLVTSVAAVFSTLIQDVPVLRDVVRMILVILPIVSVGLMNYSSQFASSTAWIEYRVGAETIRQHIYLYRMRAGDYYGLSDRERQHKLLDVINAADERIDKAGATLPYMQPLDESNVPEEQKLKYRIKLKTDTPYDPSKPDQTADVDYDSGLSPLPIERYIDLRVRKQVDWYSGRIDRDYRELRKYRRNALIIAGLGSVLAALGQNLEALVAITTAVGVAYSMTAESRMYGATYALFHWTASKLRILINQWDILSEKERRNAEIGARFVGSLENVFMQEREIWRESAIESQMRNDNSIAGSLKSSGRAMLERLSKPIDMNEINASDDGKALERITTAEMQAIITGKPLPAESKPHASTPTNGFRQASSANLLDVLEESAPPPMNIPSEVIPLAELGDLSYPDVPQAAEPILADDDEPAKG